MKTKILLPAFFAIACAFGGATAQAASAPLSCDYLTMPNGVFAPGLGRPLVQFQNDGSVLVQTQLSTGPGGGVPAGESFRLVPVRGNSSLYSTANGEAQLSVSRDRAGRAIQAQLQLRGMVSTCMM